MQPRVKPNPPKAMQLTTVNWVWCSQAVQAIMNCVTTLWKLDSIKFEAVLAPLVTRSAYLLRQRAAVGAGQRGHLNAVALQQLLSGLRDASSVVARPDYLQVDLASSPLSILRHLAANI